MAATPHAQAIFLEAMRDVKCTQPGCCIYMPGIGCALPGVVGALSQYSVSCAQEELRQWAEASQQREAESLALAAAKHQDDKRITELTHRLGRCADLSACPLLFVIQSCLPFYAATELLPSADAPTCTCLPPTLR